MGLLITSFMRYLRRREQCEKLCNFQWNYCRGIYPGICWVTKDTAKSLDIKKEDVFLNFEDARTEAMRRGSSLVIEVRRDKNGL